MLRVTSWCHRFTISAIRLTDTSSGSNSINLEPEGEPGNYDEDDGRDVDLQDVKSNISLQDESDFQTGKCTCKINQFIFQLLRYDLDIILLCLCVLYMHPKPLCVLHCHWFMILSKNTSFDKNQEIK